MLQPMDDASNQAHWDRKFKQGLPSLTTPDPFFISAYQGIEVQSLPSGGRALDLAAGLGRHALWLAERAWQVSAVDVSAVAIEKLGQTARHLNVNIDLFTMDVAKYTFDPAGFDLVILFYHLDRDLFPKIISALKPGGVFICKMAVRWRMETELVKTSVTPLVRHELTSLVSGLEILHHRERPVRDRGVVEFVGRKPNTEGSPAHGRAREF
jgi:SAM-dependent methyltransferase